MKLLADLIDNVLKSGNALADVNPGVRTEIDMAVAKYAAGKRRHMQSSDLEALISKGIDSVWKICARCESPIEKLIVPWLVFQDYQLVKQDEPVLMFVEGQPIEGAFAIDPQFAIDNSRFDFLLVARLRGRVLMLGIECDGKAFHSEEKDFYRDRSWEAAGISTVRLTGSAIHQSPERATLKVAQALQEMAHKQGLV